MRDMFAIDTLRFLLVDHVCVPFRYTLCGDWQLTISS